MDELRIVTKNSKTNVEKDIINYDYSKNLSNDMYNPYNYSIESYKSIKAHDSDILSTVIYNNYLITGSSDKTIKIWDLDSFKLINTLIAHTGGVYSLVLQNNKLISSSTDKTIRIWDLDNFKLLTSILAHENQIYCLYCKDNFLISSSLDKTIKIWNIEAKKLIGVINTDLSAWAITIYDNKIIAGFSDGSLKVFNLANGNLLISAKEHTEAITQIKIYRNKIYTSSKDKTIKTWNIENLALLENINNLKHVIWDFFIDENYIVTSGDDKNLKVYDINLKKIIQSLSAHSDWVSHVLHHDNKVFSFSGDGMYKIWKKIPIFNCENIDISIEELDKSPFETDEEFKKRITENYIKLAKKIIDYDYISIGSVRLLVDEYDFASNNLPVYLNINCEKIIKLSDLEKKYKSFILISKDKAQKLYENNSVINLYIKYYFENNGLRYELSIISVDEKYIISPNYIKLESIPEKKSSVKQDRLDIKINKPETHKDKALYVSEHDCNSIILSDTFKKPFEDFNDFEIRVKHKLINYRYIHCGKITLMADKYTIADEKFPIKCSFTCDKLLNIISLLPEESQDSIDIKSQSKQLIPLKKYDFYSFILIDRYNAKKLYDLSANYNLYINFTEKNEKLYFELFILFDNERYFIM